MVDMTAKESVRVIHNRLCGFSKQIKQHKFRDWEGLPSVWLTPLCQCEFLPRWRCLAFGPLVDWVLSEREL